MRNLAAIQQGARFLFGLAIAFAAAIWVWPMINYLVPRGLERWGLGLVLIVSLTPLILFEVYSQHPFDATSFSKSTDYQFRSIDRAMEFAAANQDTEWVTINNLPYDTVLQLQQTFLSIDEAAGNEAWFLPEKRQD